MKRVLLTGASGFVGRHCLPALAARGYEIHAVSAKATAPTDAPNGVNWHQVDLLDDARTASLLAEVRPTHLLHCAWYAIPGKYWESAENLRWLEASLHLLRAFAACGGKRVVGVGSCAEYDWDYGYCAERRTPLRPTTTYGVCKHALQLMLDALCRRENVSGTLSGAWGRLFFLYGAHEYEQRLVASVIRSLLQEQPAHCSHGRQVRDFLHVQDAADALVALLDADAVTGAVNIASGVPVTLRQVVGEIAAQLERPDLIQLDALPAPAGEPHLLLADVARLRDEVQWSPRYDLSEGLADTIKWWKHQL
jgi:nucleoside-diphosphate-sugar epimerase